MPHLSACGGKKHFLSSAFWNKSSNLSSGSRNKRCKTDPDWDDATVADISLTFGTNIYLRLINPQQTDSSDIDTGLTKVTLWMCLWMCEDVSVWTWSCVEVKLLSRKLCGRRRKEKEDQIVLPPSALYEHAAIRFVCQGRKKEYWIGSMSK